LRGKLEEARTYLREYDFRMAALIIDEGNKWACRWLKREYNYTINPVLSSKFLLCLSLALTALGNVEAGMVWLETAESSLTSNKHYCPDCHRDLIKDLQKILNSELVKMGSIYRCEWTIFSTYTRRRGHIGWEEGEGSHPFWEWLDLAEDGAWLA
jgi:hypothetical protein